MHLRVLTFVARLECDVFFFAVDSRPFGIHPLVRI